jgi:hypothetical protein
MSKRVRGSSLITRPGQPDALPSPVKASHETSNIMVCVRVRPFTSSERGTNLITISNRQVITLHDPTAGFNIPEEAFRINRTKEKTYAFDMSFGPETG